jgi:NTE family protein
VLSVLLPELQARGQRPTVLVGSSVGAINATYLAGRAHLDAEHAVAGLIQTWRDTTLDQVIRPILSQLLPLLGARAVGSLLSVPGVHLSSLLDPSPVADNLRVNTDWGALRRSIDDGVLDAVAVVATAVRTERTVVFCDATDGPPTSRTCWTMWAPTWMWNTSKRPRRSRCCSPRRRSPLRLRLRLVDFLLGSSILLLHADCH